MAKRKAQFITPMPLTQRPQALFLREEEDPDYQCVRHEELLRKHIRNFQTWNQRPNTLFVGKFHVFLNTYESEFCSPLAKVPVPKGFLSKTEVDLIATKTYHLYVLSNDRLLKKLALLKDYQLGCFCPPHKPIAVCQRDGTWAARCHCDVLKYLIDLFEDEAKENEYQVAGIKMPPLGDEQAVLQAYFNEIDQLELVGQMLDPPDDGNVRFLNDRHWRYDLSCKKDEGHNPCLCYHCRKSVYDEGRTQRELLIREVTTEDKHQFFEMTLKQRAKKYRTCYIAKEIVQHAVAFFGRRRNPFGYSLFEVDFKRMVQNTERASFHATVGPQSKWMHIDEDYDPHVDGAGLLSQSLWPRD